MNEMKELTSPDPIQAAFAESKVFPMHGKPISDFAHRQTQEIMARANWLHGILECQPPSREINLAKTKLEESVMWAAKAIRMSFE